MNELRTLEETDFRLDGPRPIVTVQPQNEKARRGAVLPLSADASLAADLAGYFASRPLFLLGNADVRAFPNLPARGTDMLRADMDYARKRWRVEQYIKFRRVGLSKAKAREEIEASDASDFLRIDTPRGTVDFHALRHTFGTWLAQNGVHPKVCQEMMRHADIETTMQLYTHTLLEDKDKAARALPDMGTNSDAEDVEDEDGEDEDGEDEDGEDEDQGGAVDVA